MKNLNDIRLIAVDMDGTLLNTHKELPPRAYEIIRLLHDNGVKFAAASGRQYYNLREVFAPVADDMIFIADNGGAVFEDGALISDSTITDKDWRAYAAAVEDVPTAFPVVCGVKKAYIKDLNPNFLKNVASYYRRFEAVEDFEDIDDDIIKIALYDERNAERDVYPLVKQYADEVKVKVSGDDWVDINAPDCNKGEAIKKIQEKYGITPEQTMVFGDFLNDLEMMDQAKYSYAMKNAHPELKARAAYEAPYNDDNGVMKVIGERFDFDPQNPA